MVGARRRSASLGLAGPKIKNGLTLEDHGHWATQNFQKQNRRGRWSEISSAWGDDMGLSTSSSLSTPGSHAKRRGLESPRFCSSSKFCFLRNGLRGESDNPCGWADSTTPPPSDHAHLVITFSPIRLCRCRTQLHHRSSHPPNLPGPVSALLPTSTTIFRKCETRCKHRPSLFAAFCTEREAPQHHTPPPQPLTRHVSWGNTGSGAGEHEPTKPHTNGEGGDDWMRDTSHFPSLFGWLNGQLVRRLTDRQKLILPGQPGQVPAVYDSFGRDGGMCVCLTWCTLLTAALYPYGIEKRRLCLSHPVLDAGGDRRVVGKVNCDDVGAGSLMRHGDSRLFLR